MIVVGVVAEVGGVGAVVIVVFVAAVVIVIRVVVGEPFARNYLNGMIVLGNFILLCTCISLTMFALCHFNHALRLVN